MPITPPDIRSTVKSILKRLDALERRLSNLARRRVVRDIPFTVEVVSASTSQPYYLPEPGGVVFEIVLSLRTPGTTDTTIDLLKNGNVVATVTIAAGSSVKIQGSLAVDYNGNQDRMNVEITAPGSGALGLDVQVRTKVDA